MKKNIFYIFLIFIFILSVIVGYCGYGIINQEKTNNHIYIGEQENRINVNKISVETDYSEEKILFNTLLTFRVYYTKCDHVQYTYDKENENYINLTKEQIQKKFPEWTLSKFSKEKVVFEKEIENICPKHFIIRQQDGIVTVYHIVNNEEVLYKVPDVSIEYLTEEDINQINNGIYVYGDEELNARLEDFE